MKQELTTTYDSAKNIIRSDLESMSKKFITIGYYLKYIRDHEMYRQDGFADIWQFAQDTYGISKSTCSRWMSMNDRFSKGGNSPYLKEEYRGFGKSQLQEMLYLDDSQMQQAKPEMTAKEIRNIRTPEPLSYYGTKKRTYPEGSLLTIKGCEGGHDCFRCHMRCDIRQKACYCVEAPMGNPFPCTTIPAVDNLKAEIGDICQFVNLDLAERTAGSKEAVPCCKKCSNPCKYECPRSAHRREKLPGQMEITDLQELLPEDAEERAGNCTLQEPLKSSEDAAEIAAGDCCAAATEKIRHFTEEPGMENAYGWTWAKLVEKYLETSYSSPDKSVEVECLGSGYHVLKRESVTVFYDEKGNTLFDVTNVRLAREYEGLCRRLGKEEAAIAQQEEPESAGNMDIPEEEPASGPEADAVQKQQEESVAPPQQDIKDEEQQEIGYNVVAIKDYLLKQEKELEEYEACEGIPERTMLRKRMVVDALRLLMKSYTEEPEGPEGPEEPKQPELPVFKNNDQRKEWLRDYQSWGLWYEDRNIGARYYKYDFENGARLIAEEYTAVDNKWRPSFTTCYLHLVGGPEPPKNRNGIAKWTRNKKYSRYPSNETELAEFLKETQKEGRNR